jgi:hypothetical protein
MFNYSMPVFKKEVRSIIWNKMLSTFNPKVPCTFTLICKCSSCRLLQPSIWNDSIFHIFHILSSLC